LREKRKGARGGGIVKRSRGGRGGTDLRLMAEARTTKEFSVTLRVLSAACFPFRLSRTVVRDRGGEKKRRRERKGPGCMNIAKSFKRNFFREVEDTHHAVRLVISNLPRECESWETF
jgi:hypothetical protein